MSEDVAGAAGATRIPAGRVVSIPDLSLVVLIGASGSGKSTFARRVFRPTEVISSDACRALVSDDENDQAATDDAFAILHAIAGKRLERRRLTVIDATNVQPEARKPLLDLARAWHALPVAIVLDVPEKVCRARNAGRAEREFGAHVIPMQVRQLRRSIRTLKREGFRYVHVLSPDDIEHAILERRPLWNDRRGEAGPFDIIGDVHGCFDELVALLEKLGWEIREDPGAPLRYSARHPEGRKAIFLGDLVDRGPRIADVLRLAMAMVASGAALCIPGNHEAKLLKKLRGKDVKLAHGLAESVDQLGREPPEFVERAAAFIDALVSHYVLDGGRLVVAHAGLKESLQGRASGAVRSFALYGETTGETDEFGLPVRYPWAAEYRGRAFVVYGHTPVPEPEWVNRTINIDTGCVFGGALTALRYPERETTSVPAARVHCEPAKPLRPEADGAHRPAQHAADDVLDIEDVIGKRIIETPLARTVTIRAENATAALEAMTRFGADPRWLIYLPPTMSPCGTCPGGDALERPEVAFAYYEKERIERVVCEEKHMGSRAIVIACRDEGVARARFGVEGEGAHAGIIYTRTGRRFFEDAEIERDLIVRIRAALDTSGFWESLRTDWVCLDTELMPWSAKAQSLLRDQYAAVGAAARGSLLEAVRLLEAAAVRLPEAEPLLARAREREELAGRFVEAYRRYSWSVASPADLRIAPFHLLATEGACHAGKDHVWHMETIAAICAAGEPLLVRTPYRVIDLADPESRAEGARWWEDLTAHGGEGMVVKPLAFVPRGRRGPAQPAVKVRGAEYLRIIYGPEYTEPANIERLRKRGLARKRSLALREFALGLEALERFVRREPLRRVHECVFGVLALESEPVDPRL